MAMTTDLFTEKQLADYVWRRLGVRKHTVGKEVVARATACTIKRWPFGTSYLTSADADLPTVDDPAVKQLTDAVTEEMHKYGSQRYGFVWAIVLSAVISQLVKLLIEWWLKRRENRLAMQYMTANMAGEDYRAANQHN